MSDRQLRRRRSSSLVRSVMRTAGTAAAIGTALALSASLVGGIARAETSTSIGGPALSATGVVVDPIGSPGSAPPLPTTSATSFVVADLSTGDVLAAKSAHELLPPASTLKMLTADVLLPRLDRTATYVGTPADALAEGSKVGVDPGLTYTVDQLFQGLLLMSGNDAAHALSELAGGEPAIVALMADRAEHLQALDTTVVNVSGLDAPGQLSSAYDLALIARDAMKNPDFRAYVAQRSAEYPNRDGGMYQIQNLNRLLGSYDGAIGIKTGFTTLGRTTFVGAATRGGHTILVTVMHLEGRGEVPAAALLDWAFTARDSVRPVGSLVEPIDVLPTDAEPEPPSSTPQTEPSATDIISSDVASADSNSSTPMGGIARGLVTLAGVTVTASVLLRLRVRRRRL